MPFNITPVANTAPKFNATPVSKPSVNFPFLLKEVEDYSYTGSAETKEIELAKAPMAALILQWDMLGNAGAATIANALTQVATTLKVTDGGKAITPTWSAAEWYEYLNAFYGHICPFQDGTAADNKLALLQMVIPFGRPSAIRNPSLFSMFDPLVGFNPVGTPALKFTAPAAGSSIDTLHLKVGAVYMNNPPMYNKRWMEWAEQTLSTAGAKDWILEETGKLCEMFMYQTSSYNDTLTSDAPTLKKWDLTIGGKSIITDGQMFNMLGSLQDVTAQPDDDYIYVPFCKYPSDDFSLMPNLGSDTRFRAYGGVADAFKATFSILNPV